MIGCKEPAWSPRHFSNTDAGLDGLVQSWTNISLLTRSSHALLALLARLPAGSSLQEVAAHQEWLDRSTSHLSTCFQSLLQEKMPGRGNRVMEKVAELPHVGAVPWVKDLLGCQGSCARVPPRRCEGGGRRQFHACVIPTQPRKLSKEVTASLKRVAQRGWGSQRFPTRSKSPAAPPGVVGFILGCCWCFCFNPDLCSHQGTIFESKKDFCCLNAQIRYFDDCRAVPISCIMAWWPRPRSGLNSGNCCIFPQKNVSGFIL